MSDAHAIGLVPERVDEPRVPLMRSPVSRMHAELGARFEREAGWELPMSYGDRDGERALAREQIAVADVTARGKVDLRGRMGATGVSGSDGELVARLSDSWRILLSPPGPVGERVLELESFLGAAAMVTDATHMYAGFALLGPRLPDALARLTGWNPATLEPGAAAGAPIAEVRAVVLRRALEVPTLEVYVETELARFVWQTILRVVEALGGGPAGWEALRAEGWS